MEGTPITQVWDTQILDYEYFAMVKGGPNDANGKDDDDAASSSSDDGSSGDESDELEEVEVRAWDADLPPTHDTVEGSVEAARLAVTDQEWKHCRAQDLLVMLQSLCPPGGQCSRVAVYASDYGAREMEREEKFGPGIGRASGRGRV